MEVQIEGYRYLGDLQLRKILNLKRKDKITMLHITPGKKVFKTKLYGERLMINGMGVWR